MRGKLIGGLLGLFFGGIFGALLGLAAGHMYDSVRNFMRYGSTHMDSAKRQQIQQCFFETSFRLMGCAAKSDGRVSESEVEHTEALMQRMGLTAEHRNEAIGFFKEGTATDFNLDNCLQEFNRVCGNQVRLKQTLLSYIITLAMADGAVDETEKQTLQRIAAGLGIPAFALQQLLALMQAQAGFCQAGGSGQPGAGSAKELENAYQALGVSADNSDAEIKKAYRKLISENHPDKLIGQGMPEDMVKLATERSQEIRRAYEIITRHRTN